MFDVKENGIGPFTDNLNSLFKELEKLLAHNYKLDDKYLTRRKAQINFANDANCCKRAFAAIIKLPAKQKPVVKKQPVKKPASGQQPNTYLYF
jgi:hypothetical protein